MCGDGEWCSKHTLSRSSGQATNRLVGNLGEMPQKTKNGWYSLRDKREKSYEFKLYKRMKGSHKQDIERGKNIESRKEKKPN